MISTRILPTLAATVAVISALAAAPAEARAKGLEATHISLPKGPGSVEGLGKNFTPSLASGTASYGVDIAVPPAAGGMTPKLSLDYDSGGGISELGIGWKLSGVPEIRRRTENGLPRFTADDPIEIDGFGAPSDLLEISKNTFRPQYESGSFVRVQRSDDGTKWESRDKSGITYRFGGDGYIEEEGGKVATWLLREQIDLFGHTIKYAWKTDGGRARLDRVTYNDFSPDARNEVVFHYEARPDKHTRFSAGIKQLFADRVTSIEVLHGGALVRRYDLTYAAGAHSQLATVTMFGSDGATKLPTLSLSYTEAKLAADAGGLVAMATPPGRSPSDANVELTDLDGDGLPDVLVTKAGAYRSYINHDGASWKPGVDWPASTSPSLELAQTGVQLADADGDGAVDLIAKSGTAYLRYFPGKDATSFGAPVSISKVPNFTFEDADTRLADMDGDRRVDVVVTTSAGLAIGYNASGTEWSDPTLVGIVDPKQPLRFSDSHTQLCDVNGDRVQDLCYLRSGSLVYWLGRGRGVFEPAATAAGVPEWDSSAPWQLVDLDGDGWIDLLYVGVTNVQYALGTGEGAFAAPQTISGTPTKGPTGVVKLADMNGTGTTDIVWVDVSASPEKAWQYLELFPQGRAGLLRSIDNGLGKRVAITYGAASKDAAAARDAGAAWATRMNVGMLVVKALELESGLADPKIRIDYLYRDGTYSATERTFAGFGGGLERALGDLHTPTLLTDSAFDVGLRDRTLRGVLLSTTTRGEDGYIFSRVTNTWATRKLDLAVDGRAVTYSFKASELTDHIEGNDETKKRSTLVEFEQDDFGNVTAEKRWGEVKGADKRVGNDEAITLRTFANNAGDWIIGRIASEELQDAGGARVRAARYYYDGDAFEGLPLGEVSRGLLSREEGWVGPATDAYELAAASAYDKDGNVTETRDGRGGGHLFTWDPTTRAFVVAEGIRTGTRILAQQATYDARFGAVLSFTNYNGAVSAFEYDALGRVVAVIKPGDSRDLPTLRYGYELGAPLSRVSTEARVFSGASDVERSFAVFDGFGRKRASFGDDGNGRWAVFGISLLDARGVARRTLIPVFVGAADVTPALVTADGPGNESFRDASGRNVRTRTQLGLETRTLYEPLVTKTWDAAQNDPTTPYEHTPVVETVDGLGRVRSVVRTAGMKSLVSSYAYNAANDLLSRTDPEGSTASYTYDGRGRRLLVDDPDAGKHAFEYDVTGNVVVHRFPDRGSRKFAYDLAGRLIAEDWNGDNAPEVVRTYDEGGDAFLGVLARVTDPSGTAAFTYDLRQQTVQTTLTIADASYTIGSAFDAQDRKYLHRFPDGSSLRIHYGSRGLVAGYGKDAVQFTYDADGHETTRAYNTGVSEVNGFDADRRRTEHRVVSASGATVQHLEWLLDPVGNVLELHEKRVGIEALKDRSERYGYDNIYRLTKATGRWGETSWVYSPAGNIIARTSTDARQHAGAIAYGATAGPHAPASYMGRTLKYDPRGRMLDDGERSYAWDGADHLIAVKKKDGSSEENTFDADGGRRMRVEHTADGQTHTTHFIDAWSEVRDGKLTRYIVHGGQRIVRLADGNGAAQSAASSSALTDDAQEPPPAATKVARAPVTTANLFLGVALIAALIARYRRQVARALPLGALVVLFALALGGSTTMGCKGHGEEALPPDDGTVLSLGTDDELLFSDSIGSLTETTNGVGESKASSATFPYGAARYDSSPESRKFANTPRDAAIGLDLMGARAYAPEFDTFISPDPLAIESPEDLIGAQVGNGNAYAYAAGRPLTHVDRTGHFAAAAPAIVVVEAGPVLVLAATIIYVTHKPADPPRISMPGENEPIAVGDTLSFAKPASGATATQPASEAATDEAPKPATTSAPAQQEATPAPASTTKPATTATPTWKPSDARPYSHLKDHKSVAPGKDYTDTQKKKILEDNKKRNGGVIKDDVTGEVLVQPQKYDKGHNPPKNEAQIDHVQPKSKGGSNSYSNAQVRSRENNLKKSNKTE